MSSPYQTAQNQGYSDEEILGYLSQHPEYSPKIQKAKEQGYSDEEIKSFLSTYTPQKKSPLKPEPKQERSLFEKGARIGGQVALGASESASLPYELGASHLNQPEAAQVAYRQNLMEDIETMQQAKELGGFPGREQPWNEEDDKQLQDLVEQVKNPEKAKQFVKTADVGIRGIAEKVTGANLHPEGSLEKAANWYGFVKNPKNAKELFKMGTNPKEIVKAIIPGKDIARSIGAGTALQIAEEGQFGPLGTMAAAVVGDLIGSGASGVVKGVLSPKKTLAKGASLLSNTKSSIRNDLKQAAEEKKFTKDIGTLTNNNMVQMVQARLTASGLTGKPLEQLRKQMTKEVVQEYKTIADELGSARFQSFHEAGEVAKEGIKKIRDADLAATRQLYQNANKALKPNAIVDTKKLVDTVKRIESELKPGTVKSTEQTSVLNVLEKLMSDIHNPEKNLYSASVKELMNNKIAINDIINYEIQGGTKQLLKQVVGELDRAIISHGKQNIPFVRNYVTANKKFSEHAKTFRNKNVDQLLKSKDPSTIMNRMGSVQGIRDVKKVLEKTPEGKQIFNDMSRLKLDQVIGNNMKDGVTEQLKAGKFANILEKGKNREIIKEILSPESFKRLQHLQKHVGKLAESGQKFFNASQSATAAQDLATTGSILTGLFGVFTGNPWSLGTVTTIGGILGARQLSKLIADPEFLKLTEQAIKSAEKNNISSMTKAANSMVSYVQEKSPALLSTQKSTNEENNMSEKHPVESEPRNHP